MNEDYPRTWLELDQRFQTENDCLNYLRALRWPGGWRCPRCGRPDAWPMQRGL